MNHTHLISFYILLFILFGSCSSGKSAFLIFDKTSANQIDLDSLEEYSYTIKTKGNDPYISFKGLDQSLKEKTVLTFEYQSTKGINFLEIYFLSKGTGSFGSSVAGSQKSEGLKPSEEMSVYAVDLSESIEKFNWDPDNDILRLDFGDQSNAEIVIKNIHFRKRNKQENEIYQEKENFKHLDQQRNLKIDQYLTSNYDAYITRVEVRDSSVFVEGNYPQQIEKPMLYAVKPWEDITRPEHFKGIELSKSPFSIEMERYIEIDGFLYDQALSKWVLTQDGKIESSARYADFIKPERNLPKGTLKGRKGIGGFHIDRGHISDLTDFPATSVTVNIWFSRFMYLDKKENTIAHNYAGKTYYFDRTIVEKFDNTMLEAAKHNIIVAAIILINPASQSADPTIGKLLQDEHFEGDNAFYTMPNMTSAESVLCYTAGLDFLASRYSREDNKYGRIHHWIMHNEVDAGNVWTNMGLNRPQFVFLDAYHKSMRLCYNIARKYDQNSEVFASFTHSWASPVPVDGDYATLDLLNGLLRYSKVEGDFQWALACHPYPEDLNEPKTWNDTSATFEMHTPMVTFKNLEVLDKWIKLPENKFQGTQKRTLWLSENGTNSRSYSEKDLTEQAAGFAYAWKKMKKLDGIDAFQWHNWMDGRGEFGLRIGLRKYPDDEMDPAGRKPVWFLYQAADTPREDKLFDPYKPIIGINDWSEIFHDIKE